MGFINESTVDLASDVRPVAPEPAFGKFVSFEVGGELCCVAAQGVAEVVQPFAATPLPNSPKWLLGLGAYRGEPVAVIDPRIIAEPSAHARGKGKILVFKARPMEAQFALPVESLHEMIVVSASELSQNAAEGLPPDLELRGRSVRFIDHERLFEGFHGGRN